MLECEAELLFLDDPTASPVLLCKRTLAQVTSAGAGISKGFYEANVVCLAGKNTGPHRILVTDDEQRKP